LETRINPFRMFLLRRSLFAALLVALPVHSQQPLSFPEAGVRAQSIFTQSAATGMVLVVVRDGQVLIQGYGETAPGSRVAPGEHSEIRLCSISKIFAGDLLTRLAAEGKVSLSDPLQRYAPRRIRVPEGPGDTAITLRDLATHTSGLAREVSAYPKNLAHFTFPDHATRWAWLPRQKLTKAPGSVALYSNVGFDFLGDALAMASGLSYPRLLHQTLLQPLDMWDTTLFPSADQCTRLLRGSSEQGPCTDTDASSSSGGIYSTPADMAKLLKYLLHAPGSPAQPDAALTMYLKPSELKSVQGLSHAGDPTGIGLGWVQLGDPATDSAIIQKTGGGAGFGTYIALNRARRTGIFLAVTDGDGKPQIDFFQESNNLLAALANVPPLPPKARPVRPPSRHSRPQPHRKSGPSAAARRKPRRRAPSRKAR
jgi:D-alanyl-D-alanine-carboxypeptidase/D-alanyl-D-alanine-endopeptidase